MQSANERVLGWEPIVLLVIRLMGDAAGSLGRKQMAHVYKYWLGSPLGLPLQREDVTCSSLCFCMLCLVGSQTSASSHPKCQRLNECLWLLQEFKDVVTPLPNPQPAT